MLKLSYGTYKPKTDPESLKRQRQVRLEIRLGANAILDQVDHRRYLAEQRAYAMRLTRKPYVPRPYIPRKH